MKKLFVLIGCVVSAGTIWASTCETRVDKKWDKSTQERVDSCLTEEAQEEPARTEVITSQVYPVQFPNQSKTKKSKQSPKKYKKYEEQTTYREYIDQDHYPVFRNDDFPLQSMELAHETALEALEEQRTAFEQQEAYEAVMAHQQKATRTTTKSKGKSKPKAVSTVKTEIIETRTEVIPAEPDAEIALPAEKTDTLTPAGEIQKAKAIEQDPVTPTYDEDSALKELYLNENVLGPSNFGYNDTDPAFQP